MTVFPTKLLQFTIAAATLLATVRSDAVAKGNVITLEEAYDRTLSSDQSIQIAWLEIRKAVLLPLSALATKLGPNITGSLGYDGTGTTSRLTGIIPNRSTFTGTNVRSFGLSYTQTLMDFSVFPAFRLGKLTEKSTKLQYTFLVRQTLFGVASAYYDVLKQQAIVAINKQTVDLAAEQYDQAKKRFDVGQAARTDELRAEATLEDARHTYIGSQATLAISRNTFANILNLGGDTGFELREPSPFTLTREGFDAALSQAYGRREDYAVSVIAIKQDIERRNEVKAQYAPKLVADLTQTWSGYNGANHDTSEWETTVALQIPIFTGGQREIDMRTTQYQIDETRLNHDKLTKSIQQEVKNAWLVTRTLEETIKALRAEVKAAEQNYKDLDTQYKVGAATSLDVQSALRDLNNSRTTLAAELYDDQVALRDLERSEAAFQTLRVTQATERFATTTSIFSKDKRR